MAGLRWYACVGSPTGWGFTQSSIVIPINGSFFFCSAVCHTACSADYI